MGYGEKIWHVVRVYMDGMGWVLNKAGSHAVGMIWRDLPICFVDDCPSVSITVTDRKYLSDFCWEDDGRDETT